MLVESSAVERRLSPGQITVNFFLFSRIQIKKAVIGIRLELSLTDKSVITYLSVLTLAITSASLRCMHRLTLKLAAHFPCLYKDSAGAEALKHCNNTNRSRFISQSSARTFCFRVW